MCDWIDNEIKHIYERDVVAPESSVGEFETQLVGATVPMRLRKMYTRVRELYLQMSEILKAHGLLSDDEIDEEIAVIPPEVSLQLYPISAKAMALESAICENLMGEFDLWDHAAVVIGSTWEVFYRTHEQEVLYQQYLAYAPLFEGEGLDDNVQGFDYPSGSFDPSLN